MQPEKKIWFPAKKYGWGWGFPICWQGWVVFFGWLVLYVGGTLFLLLRKHIGYTAVYAVVLCVGLFIVCYLKGEPLRWRWGKKSQ